MYEINNRGTVQNKETVGGRNTCASIKQHGCRSTKYVLGLGHGVRSTQINGLDHENN